MLRFVAFFSVVVLLLLCFVLCIFVMCNIICCCVLLCCVVEVFCLCSFVFMKVYEILCIVVLVCLLLCICTLVWTGESANDCADSKIKALPDWPNSTATLLSIHPTQLLIAPNCFLLGNSCRQ